MAAASVTGSAHHVIERLVRGLPVATGETTLPIKDILTYQGATAVPNATTALANASALNTAAFTATGVAVGDVVLGYGVVSGRATNSHPVSVYVSAADTITAVFGNLVNTSVTHTAVTMNFIVADVT